MFHNHHPEGISNPDAEPINLGMQIDNHNWYATHPADFDPSAELDSVEVDEFMRLVANTEHGAAWQAQLRDDPEK